MSTLIIPPFIPQEPDPYMMGRQVNQALVKLGHLIYVIDQINDVIQALPSGGGVHSVTGLNTDNTDPDNPIIRISVDGTSITGAGTPGNPLVANFSGVQTVTGLDTDNTDPLNPIVKISVDGITITGDGTSGNPLTAVGAGGIIYPSDEVVFGDGTTAGGVTVTTFKYTSSTGKFQATDSTGTDGIISDPANGVFKIGYAAGGLSIDPTNVIFQAEGGMQIISPDYFFIVANTNAIIGTTGYGSFIVQPGTPGVSAGFHVFLGTAPTNQEIGFVADLSSGEGYRIINEAGTTYLSINGLSDTIGLLASDTTTYLSEINLTSNIIISNIDIISGAATSFTIDVLGAILTYDDGAGAAATIGVAAAGIGIIWSDGVASSNLFSNVTNILLTYDDGVSAKSELELSALGASISTNMQGLSVTAAGYVTTDVGLIDLR